MIEVIIDEELCKGCKLCINFCPKGLIEESKKLNSKGLFYAVFNDPEHKCNGCKLCAIMCPDVAITIKKS